MDAVQDILSSLPVDQLARELGTDPSTAQRLAGQVIPALIGGMSANAHDPGGAQSLATAINDHSGSNLLDGGVDLNRIDANDGDKIVQNVFGAQGSQVTQRLGAQAGGDSEMVRKVMRLLAPIVMAYIAKQLTQGRGGPGGPGRGSGSILGDILDNLTGGGASRQAPQQQSGGGLTDILMDMLGGGRTQAPGQPAPRQESPFDSPRQSPAPAPQAPPTQAPGGYDPNAPAPDTIPIDGPAPQSSGEQPQSRGGGGLLGGILNDLLGGGRRS